MAIIAILHVVRLFSPFLARGMTAVTVAYTVTTVVWAISATATVVAIILSAMSRSMRQAEVVQ